MKVALNPAELRLIVHALDDKHQFQRQSGGGQEATGVLGVDLLWLNGNYQRASPEGGLPCKH